MTFNKNMQDAAVALYTVITQPTATFCRISHNPAPYLVPSIVIFTIIVALGALFPLGVFGHRMSENTLDVMTLYALSVGFINGLLPILGIFWISRQWGGENRSLQSVFPTLVYCIVPIMFGIMASRAAWSLYSLAVPESIFSDGLTAGLFTFSDNIIQFVVGLFFIGWMFLLHVKAIRVLNGFGYIKSTVIMVLSVLIVYAVNMAQGIVTIVISEFVL